MTQPIFLLSLPRSGSTLVQRVLGMHPDVATAPEPWLLLPQVYALRERGAAAEYAHVSAARAITAFADGLPNGLDDYLSEIRGFALNLYGLAGGGTAYFLDKTPRYYFIVDDLYRLFPEARFVFLWRNPLSVVASIVETWAKGRWALDRWTVDLHEGVERLVEASAEARPGTSATRFEDLIGTPEVSWPRLFGELGLDFQPDILQRVGDRRLTGRMGDPTGQHRYELIDREPLQKWRATISTPVRKRWMRSYLRWIGRARLATMGYELDELERDLETSRTDLRSVASDAIFGVGSRANGFARDRAARFAWHRPPR